MKKVLFILVFIGLLSGCKTEKDSFTNVKSETSQLINGLKSYSSVSEVINNFFTDSDTSILFNSRLPDGDRRPPYNIIIISISNYDHLNENGELELYFFNDRLMSTTFYPDSITYYVEELKKNNVDFNVDLIEKDLFKDTLKVNISSYTEVSLGKNYQKNKYYVCWEDVRLVQEEIRWIYKYSHLRMPNRPIKPNASVGLNIGSLSLVYFLNSCS